MTPGNRWILLAAFAVAGVLGAVAVSGVRRRHVSTSRDLDKKQIKSWENEGGNLAPARATPISVVAAAQ